MYDTVVLKRNKQTIILLNREREKRNQVSETAKFQTKSTMLQLQPTQPIYLSIFVFLQTVSASKNAGTRILPSDALKLFQLI